MREPQFHRIRRLPPYVFSEVNAMKAKARAAGHDIIDFGMGNPDQPTPQPVVDKLIEAVANPKTHRYSTSKGIPGLRRAQAAYYERRFGVTLDPETEIIATLGSKEGLANLAQAITAPGDVILAPNPSYPSCLWLHHRRCFDPPCGGDAQDRPDVGTRSCGTAFRTTANSNGLEFPIQPNSTDGRS